MFKKKLQEKFLLRWYWNFRWNCSFGIRENNYLGKGLTVDAETTITAESFKGLLSINNPNYLDRINRYTALYRLKKLINLQIMDIKQIKQDLK